MDKKEENKLELVVSDLYKLSMSDSVSPPSAYSPPSPPEYSGPSWDGD